MSSVPGSSFERCCTPHRKHPLFAKAGYMLGMLHWLPSRQRFIFWIAALVLFLAYTWGCRPTSAIFAVSPRVPKVEFCGTGKCSLSPSLLHLQGRTVPSRWLAPLSGMGFHRHCDCSSR